MTPPPNPPPKTATTRAPMHTALIAVSIAAVFIAAILVRRSTTSTHAPTVPPTAAPLTAEQTLAQFPAPSGSSATGRALGEVLAKVREKSSDSARWVNLGDTLAQMLRDTANEKYYDHAEAAYRYALRLQPQSVDAMTGMAWVTGGRHQFDQSREWANRALALDADNAAACGILGDADVELGEYDAAYAHYQKMMGTSSALASILALMGGAEGFINSSSRISPG